MRKSSEEYLRAADKKFWGYLRADHKKLCRIFARWWEKALLCPVLAEPPKSQMEKKWPCGLVERGKWTQKLWASISKAVGCDCTKIYLYTQIWSSLTFKNIYNHQCSFRSAMLKRGKVRKKKIERDCWTPPRENASMAVVFHQKVFIHSF